MTGSVLQRLVAISDHRPLQNEPAWVLQRRVAACDHGALQNGQGAR